ncbi:MAG TPA: FHA domain-containing protein, partial [Candidatus Sulfomarinibacteraceae bacterium]|nr:FHA domain-containing protein [Candidatus Sulfomarinibacteraceae bacterium]
LHASIRRRGNTFWLYDEGSERGTLLNYERLGLAPKALADGDEIQLGRVRMRFRLVREDPTIDPDRRAENEGSTVEDDL